MNKRFEKELQTKFLVVYNKYQPRFHSNTKILKFVPDKDNRMPDSVSFLLSTRATTLSMIFNSPRSKSSLRPPRLSLSLLQSLRNLRNIINCFYPAITRDKFTVPAELKRFQESPQIHARERERQSFRRRLSLYIVAGAVANFGCCVRQQQPTTTKVIELPCRRLCSTVRPLYIYIDIYSEGRRLFVPYSSTRAIAAGLSQLRLHNMEIRSEGESPINETNSGHGSMRAKRRESERESRNYASLVYIRSASCRASRVCSVRRGRFLSSRARRVMYINPMIEALFLRAFLREFHFYRR